jgi:hypothetical protein
MRQRRTISERTSPAIAVAARPTGRAFGIHLLGGAMALLACGLLVLSGCDDNNCIECLDQTPPAVPPGVFSVTGDGLVTVYWSYLEYPARRDLVKYWVWRQASCPDAGDPPINPDGPYDFLAEVSVDEPYDEFTYRFVDTDVINGCDYAYAVSAVDAAGNESALSYETVIDTPRPEGYDLVLHDVDANPTLSGLNFSGPFESVPTALRVDPTAPGTTADIYVDFEASVPFVYTARLQVRLQDYGTFLDGANVRLDWVDWAPAEGYSLTGKSELIYGHAYIVEILEPGSAELHYAKFAVTGINTGAGTVVLDWAYQIVPGLPELKAPTGPKAVVLDTEPIRF